MQFRALGLITFLGVCIMVTTLLNGFYQRQSLIQHEGSADGESFWVEQVLVLPADPARPLVAPCVPYASVVFGAQPGALLAVGCHGGRHGWECVGQFGGTARIYACPCSLADN